MSASDLPARAAVAYRRISGAPIQRSRGHSLDEDQPMLIQRLAASHGLEVVAHFTDVQSASTHARPGLLAMIDYLVEHQIDAIVVAFSDRITRSQSAQERGALQDLLTLHEVTLYASDGVFDLSQSSSILTWDVTTAVAAHRLREVSSRLRASQRRSAEAGIWRASWPPLGYERIFRPREEVERSRITCDLVPHPVMGPIVREIFERYAAGELQMHICEWFNGQGWRTNRGCALRHPTLRWMLANGIYAGLLIRERDGETIVRQAVNVEPLISTDLWQAARERLETERRIRPKSRTGTCLLAGLLWCGACGARVWRLSGARGTPGNPIYYRCSAAVYGADCTQPAMREAVGVEAILPYVRQRLRPDWLTARAQEVSELEEHAHRRIAVIEQQLSALTDLVLRAAEDPRRGITTDEYDRRAIPLRDELARLRAELETTVAPDPLLTDEERDGLLERLSRDQLRRLFQRMILRIDVLDRKPVLPPIMR